MRSIRLALLLALAAPVAGSAQSSAPGDNGVTPQDTAQPAPKKKGGLFGKMKNLSKSKLVNTVAKTALCNAVPGGSLVAGAIDAKKAKSTAGAASAAANAAAGASGQCMPGMGLADKAAGAANPEGVVAGVGVPGLPTTGLESGATAPKEMGMAPATITPEQMKQMEEQYRKMGVSPERIQAMQSQMQAMQAMRAPGSAPSQAGSGAVSSPPVSNGERPVLTPVSRGIALHGLPWLPGTAEVRPDARTSFGLAMRDLASAIQRSGKRYRVEARVEGQGKKSLDRTLAQQRAAAVVAGLVAEGIPVERLKVANGSSDKDARILLQELK